MPGSTPRAPQCGAGSTARRSGFNALGPPVKGDPRGDEDLALRGERLAGRRSRPPRPGAVWPSGPPVRRAMDRRAADLCARADRAAPAPGWLTTEAPAVRVGGGGGGRSRVTHRGRPGSRLRCPCGTERCLAQRRELECRSHGTAHQLAERALVRSAGRQLGEHVFAKLGVGSDGKGPPHEPPARRFRSGPRKSGRGAATHLAQPAEGARPLGRVIPRTARRACPRPAWVGSRRSPLSGRRRGELERSELVAGHR
jgi:hypothetical protein